jgi:hypothetical protein
MTGAGESPSAKPRHRRGRVALGIALGVLVFSLSVGAQFTGVLTGWPLITLGAVAALTVPSSREASRRVFYVGCIALGWATLVWWWPLPTTGVTRIGLVVAATLAVLVTMSVARPARLRSLVPRFRLTDTLVIAAGAFTAWMVAPLLVVMNGEQALRLLRLGWDYAAHFNMTEMIRRTGSLTELAVPGPFGTWAYSDYPKGFHAAAASIMDATVGTAISTHEAELVGFTHATALVAIASVTVVAAGLASLPQLRRRPLLAAPLVALVTLALTCGPGGGSLLHFGFPNFLLATALLACVPLVVIPMSRVGPVAPLLALSGILVGVAHNWALLLAVAFAGVVPVLLPLRRSRWPASVKGWVALGFIVGATVAGGLAAWSTLTGSGVDAAVGEKLLIDGGFIGGSLSEILLPPLVAIIGCVTLAVTARRIARGRGIAMRAYAQVLFPLTGLALLASVAVLHLTQSDGLGYYFYKLGTGVQLTSVVLFTAVVGVMAPLVQTAFRRRAVLAGAAIAFVALLATSSGAVNATSEALALRQPPGLDARAAWLRILSSPDRATEADIETDARADELLEAARTVSESHPHFWVPDRLDGSTAPRLSNQWLFALTGQWSDSSYRTVDRIWGDHLARADRPRDSEGAVRRIQAAQREAIVVISPTTLERLRDDQSFGSDRLVSW